MFERFTERARQVVVLAQDEARRLSHNYIGTEHLLLGLLREEEDVAAQVLERLDITLEEARAQVARIVGQGDEVTSGQIPFTPRAKKVLELSLREALLLGHNYIGTEHILLGLVRENQGVAARILLDFDADAEKIRDETLRLLTGPSYRAGERAATSSRQWPPRRRPFEFRVERWPETDAAELLGRLGADGWQLAGVVPSAAGSDLIFQRPAAPGEPPRRVRHGLRGIPQPGIFESGSSAVRLAAVLSLPVERIVEAMAEAGVEKSRNDPLTDDEARSIAAAIGSPITIRPAREPGGS